MSEARIKFLLEEKKRIREDRDIPLSERIERTKEIDWQLDETYLKRSQDGNQKATC